MCCVKFCDFLQQEATSPCWFTFGSLKASVCFDRIKMSVSNNQTVCSMVQQHLSLLSSTSMKELGLKMLLDALMSTSCEAH